MSRLVLAYLTLASCAAGIVFWSASWPAAAVAGVALALAYFSYVHDYAVALSTENFADLKREDEQLGNETQALTKEIEALKRDLQGLRNQISLRIK